MEIALYLARGNAALGKAASPVNNMAAKGQVLVVCTGPTTKVFTWNLLCIFSGVVNTALPHARTPFPTSHYPHRDRACDLCPKPAFTSSQGPGFVPLNAIDGDSVPEDAYSEEEARKYFGWLADVGKVSGVTVDMLAVGLSAVNIPLVGPLAAKSGGVLNIQEGECYSQS